jgi:hypothetical protein
MMVIYSLIKDFNGLIHRALSTIDRQVIINSYLRGISTINELMTNVDTQMASLAISDKLACMKYHSSGH